jgi:hypothetical protein
VLKKHFFLVFRSKFGASSYYVYVRIGLFSWENATFNYANEYPWPLIFLKKTELDGLKIGCWGAMRTGTKDGIYQRHRAFQSG